MSQPYSNTSLSLSSRLLCYIGPPSAILLTSLASPKTALLSPLACFPTVYSYQKWTASHNTNPSRRGKLELMIWIYASAGTLGLATVALFQIVICKIASSLIFGSNHQMKDDFWIEFQRSSTNGLSGNELSRRSELASSWQNWAFNGVLTFMAAGLVEETLKYLPIIYAHRRREKGNRAYLDYVLAGALSFGVVEGIGFLYSQRDAAWPEMLLTLFERMVLAQIGHLSVAALTALRAIRRDYYGDDMSWLEVLGPSVFYHGLFDFVAMSASTLEGNVGWIHPKGINTTIALFGLCGGLVPTAVWQAWGEWKGLEERDRKEAEK